MDDAMTGSRVTNEDGEKGTIRAEGDEQQNRMRTVDTHTKETEGK